MNNYIEHHGILGMHWGVRRYQNPDGTLTKLGKQRYGSSEAYNAHREYKSAKKQANKSYDKMYNLARNHPIATNFTKKGQEKFSNAFDKWKEDEVKSDATKAKYKDELSKAKTKAVREYQKQYNKASRLEDVSDRLFKEAHEQYIALGKNVVERFMASYKNETAEAKAYNKKFNKASDLDDKAFEEWNKAMDMYKELGRNKIERILTNINHDTNRKNRYERAADAAQRDADDLRKHGYLIEADAVQKVADKNKEKAIYKDRVKNRR